jgi:hypothetical protein
MFNNWYCKECFEHALTQALTDLAKFTMFSHNGAAGPKSCAGCAALERHRDLIVCVTDLDIEIEP